MNDYSMEELKRYLVDYLERSARKKGNKYICPLCHSGEKSKGTPAFSIVPNTNNTKFKCHSCGAFGDIFDIYCKANNTDLKTAFDDLSRMYGSSRRMPAKPSEPISEHSQTDYTEFFKQAASALCKCDYLTKRGISEEIQRRFGIGYIENWKHPKVPNSKPTPRIIIPTSNYSYLARDTRLSIPENQLAYSKSKVGKTCIFNLSDVHKEYCFVVEGEIDALSIIQCGFNCVALGSVSMMNRLLEYCQSNRDKIGRLIFSLDNDDAGRKFSEKISEFRKIGICCLDIPVSGDKKDPNELLVSAPEQLKINLENALKQMRIQGISYDDSGVLTIHNLDAFLKIRGIDARYNVIAHKPMFSGIDGRESSEHINENIIAIIYDAMQHDFKRCTATAVKQFLNVIVTRNKFNPVLSMLENHKWDGNDRLEQVYDMFRIDREDNLSRILMKKWFMQCICGLHNTDADNPFSLDIVLIFQGSQGAGKTRFFEHIAMLKSLFCEGAQIDTRDKDKLIAATSCWICELGEISTTMKKDIDSLKAFLTLSSDTYRAPYGHTPLEYNRMTSFCGTTNDEQFLIDETGNRRFATIPLKSDLYIDYDSQVKSFDSMQFWKQIQETVEAEIKNGKTYANAFRLSREEYDMLADRNKEHEKSLKGEEEVTDVLEKLNNFKISGEMKVTEEYMTVTEFINQHTELKGLNARQVGKVLTKLGYQTILKRVNGSSTRIRKLPKAKGIADYMHHSL